MIQGFRDRNTLLFYAGKQVVAFQNFAAQAVRQLTLLGNAVHLGDLALPGCWWKSAGDGLLSIRINDQWCIRFQWTNGVGPSAAAITPSTAGAAAAGGERLFAPNGMRPVHPGEILHDQLVAIEMSPTAMAKRLDVPVNRVTTIVKGTRGVTADTALRLARYFANSPLFWLNLQKTWELRSAEITAGAKIAERVQPRAVGA